MTDGIFGLVVRETATRRVFWGDRVRRVEGSKDAHPSIQVRDRRDGFEEDWHTVAIGGPETYDLRLGWEILREPLDQARAVCGTNGERWATGFYRAGLQAARGPGMLSAWFSAAIQLAHDRGDLDGANAKIVADIKRALTEIGITDPASDHLLGAAAALEIRRLRAAREQEPSREELLEAFRELSDLTASEAARVVGGLDGTSRYHVLRATMAQVGPASFAQALRDSGDLASVLHALEVLAEPAKSPAEWGRWARARASVAAPVGSVVGDGEQLPPAPDKAEPVPGFDAFGVDSRKWANALWDELGDRSLVSPNFVWRWFHAAMETAANASPALVALREECADLLDARNRARVDVRLCEVTIGQLRDANERLTRRLEDEGVMVAGDAEITPEEVEGLRKAWARAQGDNADPAPLSDTKDDGPPWHLLPARDPSPASPPSFATLIWPGDEQGMGGLVDAHRVDWDEGPTDMVEELDRVTPVGPWRGRLTLHGSGYLIGIGAIADRSFPWAGLYQAGRLLDVFADLRMVRRDSSTIVFDYTGRYSGSQRPPPIDDGSRSPTRWHLVGDRLHSDAASPDAPGILVDTDPSWSATETLFGRTFPVLSDSLRMTRTGIVFVQVQTILRELPTWIRASPLFRWVSESGLLEETWRRNPVDAATKTLESGSPTADDPASVAKDPTALDPSKPFGGAIPITTVGPTYPLHRPYHPSTPIELVHRGGSIWAAGYNQRDDAPVPQGGTASGPRREAGVISLFDAAFGGPPRLGEAALYVYGHLVGVLVGLEATRLPFRDGMGAFRYLAFLENTTSASETAESVSPTVGAPSFGANLKGGNRDPSPEMMKAWEGLIGPRVDPLPGTPNRGTGRWEVRSTPVHEPTPTENWSALRTFDAPPGDGWEPFGGNGGGVLWRRWVSA